MCFPFSRAWDRDACRMRERSGGGGGGFLTEGEVLMGRGRDTNAKKPAWLRQKAQQGEMFQECWNGGGDGIATVTIMVLGDGVLKIGDVETVDYLSFFDKARSYFQLPHKRITLTVLYTLCYLLIVAVVET
ncbi:hypothetical protein Rs2_04970 [Raphanus sativus]|nr:hypothetical protein Rs2_04970 [Raphanus sativus]